LPSVPAALQALQRKVGKWGVDLELPEPADNTEPQEEDESSNINSKRLLGPAAAAAAPAVAASAAAPSSADPSK
jgi:hypothetical protein